MLKWFLKIIILIAILWLIIYKYFLYTDFSESCYIKIKPSLTELSNTNIKEAIKVLKYAVPEEYDKLCTHVDTINPNLSCGGFGGGCYYQSTEKEIDISTAHGGFLGMTAAIIAHETCHAIQHQEGRALNEQECYEIDDLVLKTIVEY